MNNIMEEAKEHIKAYNEALFKLENAIVKAKEDSIETPYVQYIEKENLDKLDKEAVQLTLPLTPAECFKLTCTKCDRPLNVNKAKVTNAIMLSVHQTNRPSTDKDCAVALQIAKLTCECGNVMEFRREADVKPTSNKEYSEKMKSFLRERNKNGNSR
jgi:hypothetical protein